MIVCLVEDNHAAPGQCQMFEKVFVMEFCLTHFYKLCRIRMYIGQHVDFQAAFFTTVILPVTPNTFEYV